MSFDATLEELRAIVPEWLPNTVTMYIAHLHGNHSMRAIAREFEVQPSTVSRKLKVFERKSSDKLLQSGLQRILSDISRYQKQPNASVETYSGSISAFRVWNGDLFRTQCSALLKALLKEHVLLVALPNLDKIVVGIPCKGSFSDKPVVVDRAIAEAMALSDMIYPVSSGVLLKYAISRFGRDQVACQIGTRSKKYGYLQQGTKEVGPGKSSKLKAQIHSCDHARCIDGYTACLGEPPINTLARLRDRSGERFLSSDLVDIGQRFREDFEHFRLQFSEASDNRKQIYLRDISKSFEGALEYIGPELSEVAVRCCCYMHGMEKIEKDLNWSARSGKIVLRIALNNLKRYYSLSAPASNTPSVLEFVDTLTPR